MQRRREKRDDVSFVRAYEGYPLSWLPLDCHNELANDATLRFLNKF